MKNMTMRQREHLLLWLALADTALFVGSYFLGVVLFYVLLFCSAALVAVWLLLWRCPHCGKQLWWNFDLPCKHCGEDIYRPKEEKPRNSQERTGFFGW